MKSIFRFFSLLAILLPYFISAQNLEVSFDDGFLGVVGNNTQKANGILSFSTLGIASARFYQAIEDSSLDGDGNRIFTVQGNDIIGEIEIVLNDGSTISYPASVTWRVSSNPVEAFGVIFSGSDDPPVNFGSITYNTNTLQLYSGSKNGQSSNLGLVVPSSGYSMPNDGQSESGNAASAGDEFNAYYLNSVSSTITVYTSICDWAASQNGISITFNDTDGDGYPSANETLTSYTGITLPDDLYYSVGPVAYKASVMMTGMVTSSASTSDSCSAGFTKSETTLTVNESGSSATFTVVLDTEPSTNVVISLSSDDTGEAAVSPASLTFTSADWNAVQTVTVTGVDDSLVDGDQTSTITLSASSSDGNYNALSPQTVSVTTTDDDTVSSTITVYTSICDWAASQNGISITFNDTDGDGYPSANETLTSYTGITLPDDLYYSVGPVAYKASVMMTGMVTSSASTSDSCSAGFTKSETTLTVNESGSSATFTVVLDTEPSTNVVISLSSDDTGEAAVSPASLTFTSADWNAVQTVTVTGVDDSLVDGDQTSTITLSASSSDGNYNALSPQTVSVTTTDDDTVSSTITVYTSICDWAASQNGISITFNDTDGDGYPSANETLTSYTGITLPDDLYYSVGPVAYKASVMMTGMVTSSASTSDSCSAGFTKSETTLTVNESGSSATFTVVLDTEPSTNVVISLSSDDTGEAAVSPASLTFTSADWNAVQTVTVTGVDDSLVDGDQTSTITLSASSSDGNYNALSPQTVSVTTTDDDVAGDTTAPVITDATGDLNLGTGDVYVGDTAGVSATDNVDGDLTADIVVTGDTVDTAVPGTYTITYNVSDSAGNAATAVTRTVTVTDDDAPVITDATGDLNLGTGDVYVGDTAGVSATDNVDGDLTADIVVTGDTVDTAVPGTYTITYNVSDSAGNAATAVTRTVTVTDDDAPVITDATGDLNLGTGDVYVGDTAGVSATDNVDGDLTADIVVTGDTVDTAVPGTYTITYNVSDSAGNAATAVTRTVTVTDDDAPVITDATGDLNLGTGDVYVGDTAGVSATDNVDGDLTADIVVTGDTVDTAVPGTYTITYNVSDSAGNAATAVTRTVTVTDDDAPVITKGQSFSYTENQEAGYVVGNVLATDNIKVDKLILKSVFGLDESDYTSNEWFVLDASSGVLSLTAMGASGSANDYETIPNSYSLTIEATDTTGNSSTETVIVGVTDVDDTAPALDGLFDEVNESGIYIYKDLTLEGTLDTYEFVSNEDATWSLIGDDAESFVLVDETNEIINYATSNYNTPTNTISSKRVKLRFKVAPDYENPIDINFDNIYDLFVNVTDAYNNTSQIETEITVIPDADGDGVTDEEDPDDDNDGVEDEYDFCPGTQPGTPVDVNGCDLLIIASEEFRVSAMSATCSNTNDGEIQVTALNQNHNYEVSVTGRSGVIGLNANEGYTASITGLSKGSYQVCFTVEGDDIFEQCFTVYIDQPEALQVVSTYLESKQALDLEIAGATEYYIELNGVLQSRRGSRISLALQKGMNRVKIYTDVECQGVIEEEIFVSEKLEYAPNPVEDDLNLYVGGVDSTVKLTITDLNGVQIESREVPVPASRVYTMNMSRYHEGIYILTAEGVTIRKTIKIIKR